MTIFGWDMSHFDAPNPSTAPREGIEFITHKAGGDSASGDAELGTWWSYVRSYSTDVMLGAYWVFLGGDSPTAGADAFLARLDLKCPSWRDRDSFILQLDCEQWNDNLDTVPSIAAINSFCDRLVSRTSGDYQPIVYAPKWVYGNVTGLRYPLWASSYVTASGSFKAIYPGDGSSHWDSYGKSVAILQYSSRATIGGQGTSDADAYRGTLSQLKALLSPGKQAGMSANSPLTAADAQLVVDTLVGSGLGSSGVPTVGVALQSGAYGNTNKILQELSALAAEVNAPIDLDALADLVVSKLLAGGTITLNIAPSEPSV
jgi:GH25 family lysozyme M1 (1,4-beta-N-acetylmuramidase)